MGRSQAGQRQALVLRHRSGQRGQVHFEPRKFRGVLELLRWRPVLPFGRLPIGEKHFRSAVRGADLIAKRLDGFLPFVFERQPLRLKIGFAPGHFCGEHFGNSFGIRLGFLMQPGDGCRVVFFDSGEPGAVKPFAFLIGALGLLIRAYRPRAAQFHRPAHGVTPFLIQIADGAVKFSPNSHLILLVTQFGLFRGGVQRAPRLCQIAGDGFRERRCRADSPNISRPGNHQRAQGNSRLRFGNNIYAEARKDNKCRDNRQR